MNENKLTALLSLLDDSSFEIYQRVEKELSNLPVSVIPQLEDSWLESKNTLFQERLEIIINKINFNHVKKELIKWGKSDTQNLIEGAILVNKSYNPNLLTDPIFKSIEKIKQDVWLELNDQLTALEKIKILNHFFYNIYNYQALSPNNPTNWDGDIGTVLSQKQGNYVMIAIIYAAIAQKLNIPVYGINLPGSILLCYVENDIIKSSKTKEVLFYINPIDKGHVFGCKELEHLILAKNIDNRPKYYQPTSNTSLIKKLVKHEINVYKKLKLDSYLPNFRELYKAI
ncbi:transglutaminase family protein [Marinifilum sp. RC60d5]|uniref:transglutaminase family protein n=1 Tax=Marinifilum sp. RC60d5 TaxID=3458414 RepID=UPI0040374431